MDLEKKDTVEHRIIESPPEFIDFINKGSGVLCVTESKFRDYNGKVLKPDTFRFAKWLKQNYPGIPINVNEADARADLRSNDFWMPLVFLASDISIQIYLSIVSNYIYDMARGALKHDKKSVHLRAIYKSATGETKEFSYYGSVEGLKESIKKFDLNKFMDE